MTSIGEWAFRDCTSLTSINLPSSLTSIGDSAFYGCSSLTSIELPSTLTSVGDSAFEDSGLESVKIPEGVESIERGAFNGCASLASIDLPSTLTRISARVFEECTSLTDVYIRSLTPFFIFDPFPTTAKIYVPSESVEAYKKRWTENAAQIVGYDYK